jgi:ribonuclease E
MFSPTVTLRSGGYIVINQTEALVSIDVNSGKATREHSIEETAHKTNLEAADEIGRQLRLRDLAGLIVIDFIDMEDSKNDRNVEKRLRDAVRNDRARVQIGKISQFGLLEMSRQRLRAGVVAGSTVTCPHCAGLGLVRSTESAALRLLRALDEEGQRQPGANLTVKAPEDIVIFTLNQKRREVARIEDAYQLAITFSPQLGMAGGSFELDRTGMRAVIAHPKPAMPSLAASYEKEAEEEEEEQEDITVVEAPTAAMAGETDAVPERHHRERPAHVNAERAPQERHHGGGDRAQQHGDRPGEGGEGKRRRRRRRRGGRGRHGEEHAPMEGHAAAPHAQGTAPQTDDVAGAETAQSADEMQRPVQQPMHGDRPGEGGEGKRRRRRRGRRGRHRDGDPVQDLARGPRQDGAASVAEIPGALAAEAEPEISIAGFGIAPNTPSSPQWSLHADDQRERESQNAAPEPANQAAAPPPQAASRESASAPAEEEARGQEREPAETPEAESGPRRGGWWQRRFKG